VHTAVLLISVTTFPILGAVTMFAAIRLVSL
jgi:hypothetical protein